MQESREDRRKRLGYRSRYRGSRESDLLFSQFAAVHLPRLSDEQLDRYEALLAESDQDILAWLYGRAAVPARHDNDIFAMLCKFEPKA